MTRTWLAVSAALLVAGCTSVPSDEDVYLARWEAQQAAALQGGGLPGYDPLVIVPGASDPQPLAEAEPDVIAPAAIAAARAYVAPRNSSSLLIWQGDALVEESYFGDTDRDSLINAKSLAKPLTVIAVGRAIALGHIASLDQPAADFITEWQADRGKSKITIRHLLAMTSGLLAQDQPSGPDDPLARAYLHPRHEDVLINEYPLMHEPGTRYDYANANSELIAPLIQRATGMRYEEFLTREVFGPLGAAGGTIWLNRPGGVAHAGCCIQLPARTWLRLAILLLEDGVWNGERLLPDGYVSQMRTPGQQNVHAGLGVFLGQPYVERRGASNPDTIPPEMLLLMSYHGEPYAADDLFLFDGNGHQTVYIVPSRDLIVLRTGSYPSRDYPWDNAVLPNTIIAGMNAAVGE